MKKNKEMITFISKYSNIEYLKKLFICNNIECKTEKKDKEYYLFVSIDDYKKAIIFGLDTIYEDNLLGVKMSDINGQIFFCEYLPIMNLVLPKLKYGDVIYQNDYPEDIVKYIEKLSKFCGTNLILVPNEDDILTVYALSPYFLLDTYKERCKGFNALLNDIPFLDIFYPSIYNEYENFIKIFKTKNIRGILSYFRHTIFYDMIYNPICSSIGPINREAIANLDHYKDDSSMVLTTFFEYESSYMSLQGTFKASTEKGRKFEYKIVDQGHFSSEIWLSDELITIIHEINGHRSIYGYDYQKQNLRDNFFRNLDSDEDNDFVKYIEYFQVISNGTRLLHFSNISSFFEVYNLPECWCIEKGIDNLTLHPKIFNECTYDKNDKDLDEILLTIKKVNTKREK